MTTTRKGDTRELLLLFKLLSFNNKNTARNNRIMLKNMRGNDIKNINYYGNYLAKLDFCALNRRQKVGC